MDGLLSDALGHSELIEKKATPIVYDRNGAFLTQVGNYTVNKSGQREVDYGYWRLKNVPEKMSAATLVLEDRRFLKHSGIDLRAVLRAVWNNLTNYPHLEGASTIAMQVARMQDPSGRSLSNKILEAARGVALIRNNGHARILQHYLQLAPYGNGSHGIAHAARYYFDRPVEDLSWAQSALLAAIPQSPSRMNISRESGLLRAVRRARYCIDLLELNKKIDPIQANLARSELSNMKPIDQKHRPDTLHLALRYEQFVRDNPLNILPDVDPRINATIDLAIENDVTTIARKHLNQFRNAGARQTAVIVMERGSNAILADVGSVDEYGLGSGSFDFTRITRSPGSTLKPFIYALALEKRVIDTTDILNDIPEGASGVSNSDGEFLGPITPRQALANSRNVPATNLLRRVGIESNFKFLYELRLHDIHRSADDYGIALAIGALPSKLEYLVRGYAALADDGLMRDLRFTQQQELSESRRVMSVDTARVITSFLSDAQARLPSFPRYGPMEYPFAVAVKTGTSQNYRDAWTIAFSHKYVVGAWIGRADAGAMRNLTGAFSAAKLTRAILTHLHNLNPEDVFPEQFSPPPARISIDLCSIEINHDCPHVLKEWVRPELLHGQMQINTVSTLDNIDASKMETMHISTPEDETHIWRNPNQPDKFNRLPLKITAYAKKAQVLWMIDGEPFTTALADETVYWPMKPGQHSVQARLALAPVYSQKITVTVE